MAQPLLKIDGDREVEKMLKQLPDKLRDDYMSKACAAAARYITRPYARQLATNSTKKRTGNLIKGIKVVKRRRRSGEQVVGFKVKVGPPAYHAHLIEFGTQERRTSKGHFRGRIPTPSPFAFLRKALYGREVEVRRGFLKAVKAFIAAESSKAKIAKDALK